ncbi:hypothetical protein PR002_g29178 [Phytophthora rubi]|uniref:Uncharacterized protein n=1 Tax=Phytophthora rubi TaxID=129364 RepID=A0A6A3H2R3_9STRA|nr:hypothetical protein PR002_g29178 [Phytophthora rubi]
MPTDNVGMMLSIDMSRLDPSISELVRITKDLTTNPGRLVGVLLGNTGEMASSISALSGVPNRRASDLRTFAVDTIGTYGFLFGSTGVSNTAYQVTNSDSIASSNSALSGVSNRRASDLSMFAADTIGTYGVLFGSTGVSNTV